MNHNGKWVNRLWSIATKNNLSFSYWTNLSELKFAWQRRASRQRKHLKINLLKERSLLFACLSWIHVISRSLSPRSVGATNQRSRSCRPGRRTVTGKKRETTSWLHMCLAMGAAHKYTPELIRQRVKALSAKPRNPRWSRTWRSRRVVRSPHDKNRHHCPRPTQS